LAWGKFKLQLLDGRFAWLETGIHVSLLKDLSFIRTIEK
jgi:hypothetical protein